MQVRQLKTYHTGDEIYWNDPDGGCSRIIKIKSIEVKGNVATIVEEDGSLVEGFAREFSAKKPPKKFYRHVVTVEILSEYEIEMGNMDLDNIHQMITDGDCSGEVKVLVENQHLSPKRAAELLMEQGSDPEFFRIDEDGNDIEEG